MELEGKLIVITGAARGLGREIAKALAARHANVALVDTDTIQLAETQRLCGRDAGTSRRYVADIADESAVERVFAEIRADFGAIDALVSNAGIVRDGLLVKAKDRTIEKTLSLADFQNVVVVDLQGVFLCGRAAACHMIEAGRAGVILNISSISRAGNVKQTSYSAAKAGVAAMTVVWAKELARHRIRVAALAPGFIETRMVAAIPGKIRERILSGVPLGRFARPDEVADAAVFALKNDYVNGRVLEIDGGLRL